MAFHRAILEFSDEFLAQVFVQEPMHFSVTMKLPVFELSFVVDTCGFLSEFSTAV